MKLFQFLKSPSWDTFAGFNFTLAWFIIQPFYFGLGEIYTYDMFSEHGSAFYINGFTQDRVFNITINTLYNLYMTQVGAFLSTVNLDAGFE